MTLTVLPHFSPPYLDDKEYRQHRVFFHNKSPWADDLECGFLTETDQLKVVWILCFCGSSCVPSRKKEKHDFLQNSGISNDISNQENKKASFENSALTSLCTLYLFNFPSVKTRWKMKGRESYIVRQ